MKVLLSGISSDRVELKLVAALKQAGIDLTVIAAVDSPAVELCRQLGIMFYSHEFRHRFDGESVALYDKLLATEKFDIIHALTNRALSTALTATKKLQHPPKLIAYRGTMGHLSWFDPASWYSYLHPRLDGIICVSDAVRVYLKKFRISDDKLTVIWKGHDPAWYPPVKRELLRPLGIPDDAVVFNFTGNIRPVKGMKYLLKAFTRIKPEERIHLLVTGEVRDKKIQKMIGHQPHVHFAGFRADATALMGACDCIIMPSINREGLPKAILEAMAQGVPAIVTKVGGMPELVVDGECGLVIPPRNVNAIESAVRTIAREAIMRWNMGPAARARIEGPFHFRHTVEKTLALYERMTRTVTSAA